VSTSKAMIMQDYDSSSGFK